MRKLLTALILFAPPALALAASPPSSVPEVAPQVVRTDHYPPSRITFPNGVRGKPGLIYSQPVGYRPLALDLYIPPETHPRPPQGFPLVIYIHGGGWLEGDRHLSGPFVDFPGVLASLAARGYVVASIDYRLSGEATFPAQIQDVKAAIRWIRSRSSEYDLDPARAMTWGASAGGHLAALTAVTCNVPALEPAQSSGGPGIPPQTSDCIQGAVSWYGVFDIATIAAQAREGNAFSRDVASVPEWRLLGCFAQACKNGQIAAASPVTYVDATDPPMLLITGTEDTIVPYQQTIEMAEKLKTVGVSHEVMVLPGVDHSFLGSTGEQTRDANLEALDATFRFIDKTMKAPQGDVRGTATTR